MSGTVGLVVVSHSRPLADAAVALAREMLNDNEIRIEIAAGLTETTFGTDAAQIVEAINAVDQGRGVVVLMDLGSAVLSAELAMELLDDDARHRVVLCPAPLVEGLVVAAVTAAGGAGLEEVAAEAYGALAGKVDQLGTPHQPVGPAGPAAGDLSGSFIVANQHGLHARPAARLVQEVRRHNARALIRNRSSVSEWVDAGSLSKIATLGVRAGDEVEVRVSGADAAETLEGMLALAARHFDEPVTGTPPIRRETPSRPVGASPGLGIGPARSSRLAAVAIPDVPAEGPTVEWRRLNTAIAAVRRTIGQLRTRIARESGPAEASIFDAHRLLLDDPALLDDVRGRISHRFSAAQAWSAAVRDLTAKFAAVPDPYQQARADDVAAVGDQVLRALLPASTAPEPASGVLIAADLTPAQAAEVDPAEVVAVLLAFGSAHAHSVILLRTKGIPVVVGAGSEVLSIPDGTTVAVDGTRGEFFVDPSADVQRNFRNRVAALAQRQHLARIRATEPAVTRDGLTVPVGANLSSVEDADVAASNGADFAGLVRTEFLFLGRREAPSVEEQLAAYQAIAESLGGRPITIRTLDAGADKPLHFLPTSPETNPALGVRGIRLSLTRPEVLADQLLAVVELAVKTPVSVMFPMVSTLDELFAACRLLDDAIRRTGRRRPRDLRLGMMVEVPAAALKVAAFARHVDFFSIGTNDLTQYALAVDRNNDAVAALGDSFDPGVLHLVRATCRGAAGHASVSVCGEFAADEGAAELLIGLGVDSLSVTAPAIPETKEAIRGVDTHEAVRLAGDMLAAEGAATVRDRLHPNRPTAETGE